MKTNQSADKARLSAASEPAQIRSAVPKTASTAAAPGNGVAS